MVVEGAAVAAGTRFAVVLAEVDDQGVVLVVEGRFRGEVPLEESLRRLVGGVFREEIVPIEHPASVGIDHERESLPRVEED